MKRRAVTALVALAVSLSAPTIRATDGPESPASSEVAQLRSAGKTALKEGRLDDAVAIFSEGLKKSDAEETTWHMLLGLALAHELKGDPVMAATHYQAFVSRSANHPQAISGRWAKRRRSAISDIEGIEPDVLTTHALVSIGSDPSGAAVTVSGTPGIEYRSPAALYLAPGQHQIELARDGFIPMVFVVSVAKGQRVTIQRSLIQLPKIAKSDAPSEPEPKPEPARTPAPVERKKVAAPEPRLAPEQPAPSAKLDVVGWSMAATGVVAIGVGVGFSLAARNVANDLSQQPDSVDDRALARDADLRSDLRNLQVGAAAFYAGGGALAAGGLLVLLLGPSKPQAVRPSVGLGSVHVGGAF